MLVSCSSIEEFKIERSPANFQSCFEEFNSILNVNGNLKKSKRNTDYFNVKSLEELEDVYSNDSFIEIQKKLSNKEVLLNNKNIFELLEQDQLINTFQEKVSYVTLLEADELLKSVKHSNVNVNHSCYDPQGGIGFCFGRATIAHMEALVRNVSPDSLKKIWIAGDMKEWGHHVATLVKAKNGWYVIDTEAGRVMTPKEWFNFFKTMKAQKAKEIMVFVSDAGRFGPYNKEKYSAVDLFNSTNNSFNRKNDYYNGYFHDYFEDLDKRKTIKSFEQKN